MSYIDFYKLHGCKNSYIYFDCISEDLPISKIIENTEEISKSDITTGADGVILLLPSDKADIKMRIFNADASEAEMCGNGVRALVKFAKMQGIVENRVNVETNSGIVEAEIIREDVKVKMFYPPNVSENKESINNFDFYRVDIGNPHAIIEVDNVSTFNVEKYGKPIENNTALFPEKTNVEFYEEVSPGILKMRVWERGSGETQACGTGACATAGAYRFDNNNKYNEIIVQMLGGDLKLSWGKDSFYMQGPAEFVFKGKYNIC